MDMENPASQPSTRLPPLMPHRPPLIELRGLLAVETVRLWAGDLPLSVWKDFYGRVLGLEFVSSQEGLFTFRHGRRRIVLQTSWHCVPTAPDAPEVPVAPPAPPPSETPDGLYALAPLAENAPASPAPAGGSPDEAPRGRLGLLLTSFDSALAALRARGISPEVFHQDSGLTRWATLRDPAGNLVHLAETRPF